MVLNIVDSLNKWSNELKEMMIVVGDNPLFWLGAFVFGLIVFSITASILNKNNR